MRTNEYQAISIRLIDKHLGADVEFHVFEGQMCRPELLVEIEAMAVSDCTHNNDALNFLK